MHKKILNLLSINKTSLTTLKERKESILASCPTFVGFMAGKKQVSVAEYTYFILC